MPKSRALPPLTLPGDVYAGLQALAQANDRDILQQARHILKKALTERCPDPGEDTGAPVPRSGEDRRAG